MSAAGIYNFIVEQGAGFDRTFTYYQADGKTPVDLTGYLARMQARLSTDATEKLIDLTTENGGIVLGGAAGTVRVIIPEMLTKTLTFNEAGYDLELIPSGADPDKFLRGTIMLEREYTK